MGAVLSGSYARRLSAWPNVVLSAGLFAQGGTGIGYDSLLNDYGTRDELSSNFGVFKFLSGFGWSVNDKLSLGAALGISYATGKQKVFPETSDVSFPGFRFDGGSTVAPNIHAGLQYRLAPEWTLALAYVSKLKLDLKDGTATFNFEAAGLGRVKYADARIEGFALPQEVDIGVAYAPNSRWLLSLEFNWLDYEDALNDARLRARQPNNPAAQEIDAASPLHWNNQRVVAFGAAYASDDKTTWRAGCNFENSPIPDRYYSPILNLGQKREVTLGYGKRFAMGWAMDFAFEYQLPVEIRYRNPSLAIGESGKDQYEDVSLMIALSRRW
jgi:long-chain fatty acid transport protein